MLRDFYPYISFGCFITSMYNLALCFPEQCCRIPPLCAGCAFSLLACYFLCCLTHSPGFTFILITLTLSCVFLLFLFLFTLLSFRSHSSFQPLFLIPTSFSSSLYQMSYPLSLPSSILLSLSMCFFLNQGTLTIPIKCFLFP